MPLGSGIVSAAITSVSGTYKDLADFGFIVGRPRDVLSGPIRTMPTAEMPGVMQAVRLNTSPTGGVQSVTIEGTIIASTLAELLSNVRELKGWCARAVALKTFHDANSFLEIAQTKVTVTPRYPTAGGMIGADATIEFQAADPFWYASSATTVNFLAGATATPLGTADSWPIVRATGAFTNLLITVKDYLGATVATLDLTITLGNIAHYVEIDCRPVIGRTIVKHTGALSDAADTLTAGNFFGFLARHSDRLTPAWGTIEAAVDSGSLAAATAIYRAAYE